MEAMYLMLQQQKPEDFVIATGITTSIREFVCLAFSKVGIHISFKGSGLDEIAFVSKINQDILNELTDNNISIGINDVVMCIDKNYYRPTEVDLLIGDPSKAKRKLNWKPKYNLDSLIEDMISSDLKTIKNE